MEVDSNMGGESPGVGQPDAGSGYPDQFRDSLDERPPSNSSADSRGMDDSPIDEPVDSQESLNAEKQYQDDLKERVRQSFKDLGMEPEGVLKEDPEKAKRRAKRKKKQQASERQTSHKSGRNGSEDDTRGDSEEDMASDHSDDLVNNGDEPANYGEETNGFSKEPQGQSEPIHGSNDPAASNYPDPEGAYGDQATPTRHPGDQDLQNEHLTRTYPSENDNQIPHGHPDEDHQGDHAHDSSAGQDGPSATRLAENVTDVENNRAPVNYPKEDQYEDTEYGNNRPDEDEGIKNHSKPGVDPTVDDYPEEGNYPERANYPEKDNYPDDDRYPEDARYPEENTYPEEGSYPEGGSYPERGSYPAGDSCNSVPHENAYTAEDENNYPKDKTPPMSSSLPRRYGNQDYADDEEQYDDRNQASYEHQEPFVQIPKDSLDYGQPIGNSNDALPPDSLDFEEPDNSAKNSTGLGFPNPQVSESYPQDSLDVGYPKEAYESTHANDTHNRGDTVYQSAEEAPYDSLDDEPNNVPNTVQPKKEDETPNAHAPQQISPEEERPGNQQPLSILLSQIDASPKSGHSSSKSSANSSREIPGRQGSGRHSNSPSTGGSAGLQDLPPPGSRKTSSRSGSRGLGSRGSNCPNYSDLARQRASANQNGSAGSNKSDKSRSPQQNPQSQGTTVQGNQTRVRSLSNRIRATPIPADELSAKELLKRTRSKSDAQAEVPRVEHSNSEIVRKNGEEVRVAYISDDSGDEGEHFLDEKGSPIDHFGKPLYKDLHGEKKPEEPKLEFRIKPVPPKDKSPLELQTLNARRTSADDGRNPSGKKSHGGKITLAKPFPIEEPIVNEVANQNGLSDETLPPQHYPPKHISEPNIQETAAQQEGVSEFTHPPSVKDRSTQKDETESPSGSASKSRAPFREVRLRSVGTIMSGKSMGRTPPIPETRREDPYRDLRFENDAAQKHGRDNKSAVDRAINKDLEVEEKNVIVNQTPLQTRKPLSGTYKKEDFVKPGDYPSVSRGASGGSYQDRAIQYTPQAGQNRQGQALSISQGRHDPTLQQRYGTQQGSPIQHQNEFHNQQQHYYPNAQNQSTVNQQPGLPGASQYIQGNPGGFPIQQGWEQQPPGVQWNNAHPSQVPQQFSHGTQPAPQYDPQLGSHNPPEGHLYNQQYSGYNAPLERPDVPYQDQTQYYDQQHPYDTGYQNNPGVATQQARPPGPQDYINQSQNPNMVHVHPHQGMQPAPGHYPNPGPPARNDQPRQRGPPKPKPNFIDLNKTNLARGPPRRKYAEMQKKLPTPTRINPTKPLPDISRESSQYDDPLAEDVHNLGSAQTWANEDWTRQLIQDQRNLPLRRGHSDTNLYVQNQGPGSFPQGYYPQGVPGVSGYNEFRPGYVQAPQAFQPGYNQTYPPQGLRNPNGQPQSYSADHATHFARNNGFGHPQMSGPPRARVAFADDYHGNSFDSDMNPLVYANEGAVAGYQHAAMRASPYQVLPDIPGHPKQGEDGTLPLRKSDPDSYTARLLKQKQPPQYKEYTIKDYRNLKKDIRLGGLGPDQELISEKKEKVHRQRDYAKVVMQQNKKQLQQTKRLWPHESVTPKDATPSKRDIALAYSQRVPKPRDQSDSPSDGDDWPKDSRTLAMEYSKKVPKPRMPTPPEVLHERMYGASSRQHGASSRQLGASSRQQAQEEAEHEERAASEIARLEELRARHEKEKEEVERLKMEAS